jgi:molecular chaperone DnaJ
MRLRDKGLPAVQGYGSCHGELVVDLNQYVAKTLSSEEKKAIEAFKDSYNFTGDKLTKDSRFQHFKNYFS